MWLRAYLVCWHQVNQHRVQQLLGYGVTLTDDGAHQVHHVHVHFLVVAVAGGKRGKKGSNVSKQAANIYDEMVQN